jgi:hypothetical protein
MESIRVLDLKTFVPAKDHSLSQRFYVSPRDLSSTAATVKSRNCRSVLSGFAYNISTSRNTLRTS